LAHLGCIDHTWLEVAMGMACESPYPMVLLAAAEFGHFSRHRPRNPGSMRSAPGLDRPWNDDVPFFHLVPRRRCG